MNLYYCEITVNSYTISVVAESPAKCRQAICNEYVKQFGSYRSNGFANKADWLEYHDIDNDEYNFTKLEIGKAWLH